MQEAPRRAPVPWNLPEMSHFTKHTEQLPNAQSSPTRLARLPQKSLPSPRPCLSLVPQPGPQYGAPNTNGSFGVCIWPVLPQLA